MLCGAGAAPAQDAVRTGPPPEIRAIIDGAVKALNAGGDAWEAYAQQHFSADQLKRQSAAERKQILDRIRAELGTVTMNGVMRRGPDAPLELNLRGSTGVSGVIGLEIENGSPPRVAALTVDLGSTGGSADPDDVPPPPINPAMSHDALNRALDGYFRKLTGDETFSGVALVAKGGVPVFYNAYGMADRAARIANTLRTRFNIGSINKTFTQIAIRQLVSEGKLAYTDTLGKFFPDYPQEVSRAATIRQLLDHQAGVSDFFGPEFTRAAKDRFRSNADYFRFVGSLPPAFAPGARNQYCNGCYIALGAIIERVAGVSYEEYVADRIFRRAEMTSTGYPQRDGIEPDLAIGYTRRGDDSTLRSNVFMHGAAGSAAGGGYSTALDLLAFVKAVGAGRFPGAERGMGIAGGAPGTSAVIESDGDWTVIVLSNFDPPTAERIGVAIMDALRR